MSLFKGFRQDVMSLEVAWFLLTHRGACTTGAFVIYNKSVSVHVTEATESENRFQVI